MTEATAPARQKSRRTAAPSFRENYLIQEQRYRHEMGRAAGILARRAQVFAFTLAGLFLSAGTSVILMGHDLAGAAIAVTASASLATAFLAGNRAGDGTSAAVQRETDEAAPMSSGEDESS